jgi:hypothetical protein
MTPIHNAGSENRGEFSCDIRGDIWHSVMIITTYYVLGAKKCPCFILYLITFEISLQYPYLTDVL